MVLRSPTINAEGRHAGMDCRHPGSQGCSGNIHVNPPSSAPCWNDEIEGLPELFDVTQAPNFQVNQGVRIINGGRPTVAVFSAHRR